MLFVGAGLRCWCAAICGCWLYYIGVTKWLFQCLQIIEFLQLVSCQYWPRHKHSPAVYCLLAWFSLSLWKKNLSIGKMSNETIFCLQIDDLLAEWLMIFHQFIFFGLLSYSSTVIHAMCYQVHENLFNNNNNMNNELAEQDFLAFFHVSLFVDVYYELFKAQWALNTDYKLMGIFSLFI